MNTQQSEQGMVWMLVRLACDLDGHVACKGRAAFLASFQSGLLSQGPNPVSRVTMQY
jgi:hypothetical protein